jgi:hypothetical protein
VSTSAYTPRWRAAHAAGHVLGAMAVGLPVDAVRVGAEHEAPTFRSPPRPGDRECHAVVLLAGPAGQQAETRASWGSTEGLGCTSDFAASRATVGPVLGSLVCVVGDLMAHHRVALIALTEAIEEAGGELAPETAIALVQRVDPGLAGCLADVRGAVERMRLAKPTRRRTYPRRTPRGVSA